MKKEIRLAMIGMVDGNGHPYSWSAICNGYDEGEMASCPYPTIPDYLGKQSKKTLTIPGVKVTHIWTDNPEDAQKVAKASHIPNIVQTPTDVIGQVDGVIIATDKGFEHVKRVQPFIDANIPVFIDKPLCDNQADLDTFIQWHKEGKKFLSSSSMRYAPGYQPFYQCTKHLGELRFIVMTMGKSWERYGIHALEGIYPILGKGFLSVRNTGDQHRNVIHLRHQKGVDVILSVISDQLGAMGNLMVCGTKGCEHAVSGDTYTSFRKQLEVFVHYMQTGKAPFDFEDTIEMMKIIIAGIESRKNGGNEIKLYER